MASLRCSTPNCQKKAIKLIAPYGTDTFAKYCEEHAAKFEADNIKLGWHERIVPGTQQ